VTPERTSTLFVREGVTSPALAETYAPVVSTIRNRASPAIIFS
jgi:hypothetical protein